jgi:hypothetical protein
MSLRDWFAGQALAGLLAGPSAPKKSKAETPAQYATRVAEEAYLFADAMKTAGARPPTVADHDTRETEAAPVPRSPTRAGTIRISGEWHHPGRKEWVGTAAVDESGRIERTLDIPEDACLAIEHEIARGSIEGAAYLPGGAHFNWFLDR